MSSNSKFNVVKIFAWINWALAAICILAFLAVTVFSLLAIDATISEKLYALLIFLFALIIPSIFFAVNGVLINSRNNAGKKKCNERLDF